MYTRKGKIHTLLHFFLIKWIDKDRKMIRLSKDRVLEDFFIDDNGVITNKEGEVQKLNIQQNRLRFKGVQVHKIQIYTKLGWKDGKIWAIHHVDENPFNNAFKNLVYLSRADHSSLHKTGNNGLKGHHHSEETKEKIRLGNIGKKRSEETKKKMSESQKGRSWYNDGIENYIIFPEEVLPHYQKGRLKCKK